MKGSGLILVINAGSSSIKFAIFSRDLTETLSGAVESIGPSAVLSIKDKKATISATNHTEALSAVFAALNENNIDVHDFLGVAHRVVHGGTALTRPVIVTENVLDQIRACFPLAPLHNPHNLAAIEAVSRLFPQLPQFATFDTGFHATIPDVAKRYALPQQWHDRGLQRYGFHGTSYAALVDGWADATGAPLPSRILALHLGNGASLCAIRDGKSVATTMGYSPVSGITMGTRSGDIDANAVLRMVEDIGVDATKTALNSQSGLLGISGLSADMRTLSESDTTAAQQAVDHFTYWIGRHAGSMIAAMQGLDAVVFTGGIGENARDVRASICEHLSWTGAQLDPPRNTQNGTALHQDNSPVAIYRIPAQEERMIARNALNLL